MLQVHYHTNQLRYRLHSHLFHNMRAMDFHCALAQAQILRHDFVRLAGD